MSTQHQYYVYIMTNPWHTVLYNGVTNNLLKRVYQHKAGAEPSFTKRYHINKLVYYEEYSTINDAIAREKQIKAGSRKRKLILLKRVIRSGEI